RHDLESVGQARFDDLLKIDGFGPRFQSTDNRGVLGQVEQGPGPPDRDHLTSSELTLCLLAHDPPSTSTPLRSFRNRLTSGSTSRRERLARNFRWCSDSKSWSRISRNRGCGPCNSYFWYCNSTPVA